MFLLTVSGLLLSFCVYTFLAGGLFALSWHAWQREEHLKVTKGKSLGFWSWETVVAILFFAVVVGARYHTGYDHQMYMYQYLTYQKYGFFTRDFEPLFLCITRFMAGNNYHSFFYFSFWAAVEIGFVIYVVNGHKKVTPWLLLFLVLGITLIHLMNTLRQGLVECSVPVLALLISKNRYLGSLALILVMCSLHYTALFLLILFLIRPRLCVGNRKIWISIFAFVVVLGLYPAPIKSILKLSSPLISLLFNQYDHLFSAFLKSNTVFTHVGPLRLIILFSQFAVIWFANDVCKHFTKQRRTLSVLFFLSMIYVLGTNLFYSTTIFLQRPFELFVVAYLVMLTYTFLYLFETKQKYWAGSLLVLNCSYIYIAILKAIIWPTSVYVPVLFHFYNHL